MFIGTEEEYKNIQKVRWKNYQKRWSEMDVDERIWVVTQLMHTSYTFVPKEFIDTVFEWVIVSLQYERIEVKSLAEKRRNDFELVGSK